MPDRYSAIVDDEEVTVFNHVSVTTRHYVNSVNGHETFEPIIAKGDLGQGPEPEYVTERIADYLWSEFTIEVEDLGIEVVDVDSDEVDLL